MTLSACMICHTFGRYFGFAFPGTIKAVYAYNIMIINSEYYGMSVDTP